MPPERCAAEWIDAAGHRWLTVFDTVNTGECLPLLNALANHSNAVVIRRVIGPLVESVAQPLAGQWPAAGDRVYFSFGSTAPALIDARLWLPAPKANIFFPDGISVDPGQVLDVKAAGEGKLRNSAGLATIVLIGGLRETGGDTL